MDKERQIDEIAKIICPVYKGGADVSSLAYEINFYPQKVGNVVDVDVKWGD